MYGVWRCRDALAIVVTTTIAGGGGARPPTGNQGQPCHAGLRLRASGRREWDPLPVRWSRHRGRWAWHPPAGGVSFNV